MITFIVYVLMFTASNSIFNWALAAIICVSKKLYKTANCKMVVHAKINKHNGQIKTTSVSHTTEHDLNSLKEE